MRSREKDTGEFRFPAPIIEFTPKKGGLLQSEIKLRRCTELICQKEDESVTMWRVEKLFTQRCRLRRNETGDHPPALCLLGYSSTPKTGSGRAERKNGKRKTVNGER